MTIEPLRLRGFQQMALIVLRTVIGWHFLYEGYTKLLEPAWSRTGAPLAPFSSVGYLQAASGPVGDLLRSIAQPQLIPWIDGAVAVSLIAAGLMLMLGLLTQLGCMVAAALLAVFYLSAIPVSGVAQPHAEGTYLLVNKNLIELCAVLVVMSFRTGRIAGLDLLLHARRRRALSTAESRL